MFAMHYCIVDLGRFATNKAGALPFVNKAKPLRRLPFRCAALYPVWMTPCATGQFGLLAPNNNKQKWLLAYYSTGSQAQMLKKKKLATIPKACSSDGDWHHGCMVHLQNSGQIASVTLVASFTKELLKS